ncbi:MAG: GCN5-related N-acetyltransferase [Verrucomicrobiaceae bacterium]|nr:GCN5-related N-acetyltransferase [Verrucomicrobiaceae bacterium]
MTPMTPPFRFNPGEYRIKPAREKWERNACAALRRDVFCAEQGLFDSDDRDDIDNRALSIAAISCVLAQLEQVVGTVRIHETESDIWFGSRLAVAADFRSSSALGHKLIQHAVGTARTKGCERFLAHVQLKNAPLFKRMHWRVLQTVDIYGQPHLLMEADLNFYPTAISEEIAIYTRAHHIAPRPASIRWAA